MLSLDPLSVLGLIVVSFCVATAALVAANHLVSRVQPLPVGKFDPHKTEPATFLFDETFLVDATDRGHHLLSAAEVGRAPWERLMSLLGQQFDNVEAALLQLPKGRMLDEWSAHGQGKPMRLMAEWRNGLLRITVVKADEAEAVVAIDAQSMVAMEQDVALLRALSDAAPCLIWKTRLDDGSVTWANQMYFDTSAKVLGPNTGLVWPPARLFAPAKEGAAQRRVSVAPSDGSKPIWFDTHSCPLGEEVLNFAVNADGAVKAEGALREFIQTLSKTFAHLPIGLAIFGQDRRLALFNPALTDLSTLPVEFLSARPTLSAFLDELRNRQVMPEPKNYKNWRQQITALEAEAVRGTYSETWTLPSGKTYRVTGRPHPEGAIGFLFEDISSEVTLTRRFRTDTELGQAVLDVLPEAIAVFSLHGQLVQSNLAYAELWNIDPHAVLGEMSIIDAWRTWSAACEPTPIWSDVRDFVGAETVRAEWTAQIMMKDRGPVDCRFVPLPSGRTLVGFTPVPPLETPLDIATAEPQPHETA
jgi:PAS domain-containing protein